MSTSKVENEKEEEATKGLANFEESEFLVANFVHNKKSDSLALAKINFKRNWNQRNSQKCLHEKEVIDSSRNLFNKHLQKIIFDLRNSISEVGFFLGNFGVRRSNSGEL